MPPPVASVIVRTYNSAATLPDALASVRRQGVAAEIVVVDSGSTDHTLAIARSEADALLEIPQERFSYGRALNLGAARAAADVHVALSSHCVLPRADWLEIAADHIVGQGASAACGLPLDGERRPLAGPFRADEAYVLSHQHWGFTNHASAWSARTWEQHRFDEELQATEDKEWSWRALAGDGFLVVDPRLIVEGGHRRSAGSRAYYDRLLKEIGSIQDLRPLAPFGVRRAVAEWARTEPTDPFFSRARPLGRTRLIEVAARWQAGRRPSPSRRTPEAGPPS